jgi:hypothetical protein
MPESIGGQRANDLMQETAPRTEPLIEYESTEVFLLLQVLSSPVARPSNPTSVERSPFKHVGKQYEHLGKSQQKSSSNFRTHYTGVFYIHGTREPRERGVLSGNHINDG